MACYSYLMKVENQVQLADIAEVVVQDLHKQVHTLQVRQFIVGDINTHREK